MLKKRLNIKKMLMASMAVVVSTGVIAGASVWANAGTDQDPLVTLSYVEKRLQEVVDNFNVQIAGVQSESTTNQTTVNTPAVTSEAAVFEVVFAQKGQFVYFGASTEVILRSGDALAIVTENGGLADLTDGRDLKGNEVIPANHHLLIPRDDGRGFALQSDAYMMVKGSHSIVN